ncbi:MAG TPA: DUF222 domain-containing protein, partial [Pseudonocardia sp.]|nr:DUF222 domain-containing protein [Pseudonocardia sp.]
MPTTDPVTTDPITHLSTDALRSELLGLAGHLAAAQCRFLQLLAEFDRRGGWAGADVRSCAHWLSWRSGMSLRTATEQLRVAHALRTLPAITEAFAAGRISYSKVRAITRLTHPYPGSAPNAASTTAAAEDADEAPDAASPNTNPSDTTAPETSQPAAAPPATAGTDRTAPFQAVARGPDGRLTADAEMVMLDLAMAGTASHVEKVVRATRSRLLDPQRLSAQRTVSWRWDDDGTLVLRGRFPPADGAALVAAIEAQLPELQTCTPDQPVPDDVAAAGAEQRPGAVADRRAARRADALVELATRPDTAPSPNLAEGTHLIMHIGTATALQPATATMPTRSAEPDTASTSATDDAHPTATEPGPIPTPPDWRAEIVDGPVLLPGTAERLACDARVQALFQDTTTNRLYLGRTRRLASPAQLAALTVRDHGRCQFPGCSHTRYLHAHHVQHWLYGGPTDVDNLVLICSFHHTLIHEQGYRIQRDGNTWRVLRPDDTPVPPTAEPLSGRAERLVELHTTAQLQITPV